MTAPAPLLLTPTARLARQLAREYAQRMGAEGHTAWLPPQIVSFSAWQSQLLDAYVLGADDARVPITAQQALVLWESLIDREVFIGEPQVADLAQRAWRLVHEYALSAPEQWPALLLSEDSRRFKDWAAAYRSLCARKHLLDEWTFAAEIPHLVRDGRIEAPASIELVGFELAITPLQAQILEAFAAAGAQVVRRPPPDHDGRLATIQRFDEPDDELSAAAHWARRSLEEDPAGSIAVVVPDLAGRVDRVERIFRQVFDPPAFALAEPGPEPWHVSLGKPLAAWPLVADALAILSLESHRLSQPQATRILRSPFLPAWREEQSARNETLAQLARRAPYDLTTTELTWALRHADAAMLADRFAAWHELRRGQRDAAWPSAWAAQFQEELSCLGFGNGRTLDSREYQVLQRWHDLLEAFSALDVVCAAPLSRTAALGMLSERARSAVFREQNAGVPVEVLGVEEALGSQFDALWITTLDRDTWPGAPHREPLIPAPLQVTVPRATSEGCLERAQRELAGLLAAAPVIQGSFARGRDETPIEVTALLRDCPPQDVPAMPAPAPATMEAALPDDRAPALTAANARGGTGVLRNQSACPFRAFAEHRLGANDLTPPRPGLDAGQRGNVIHKALEHFWRGRTGRVDLDLLTGDAQTQAIRAAVEAALDDFTRDYQLTLTRAGRRLEQRRTERALERWLDVERQRGEFTLLAQEQPITLELGGLSLSGKIDRLDRLGDGSTLLIDYKTGRARKADWLPEARIVDPQLPAYAVAMNPQPGALAFAHIRPDALEFEGLSDNDAGTPGITELAGTRGVYTGLDAWGDLLAAWQRHLEGLAHDFSHGHAAVNPRKLDVCQHCHLHALCRIQERAPLDGVGEESGDE